MVFLGPQGNQAGVDIEARIEFNAVGKEAKVSLAAPHTR